MSTPLLIIVTLIYLYVGGEFAWKGNWPMAIMYFGYTFANIGLVWLAWNPPNVPK